MRFVLTYEGQHHSIELADGTHLLGRAPECDLQIPVRTVSGKHAKIRIEDDRVFIRDLGSTNGTDIDGVTLTPEQGEVELHVGGAVRFAGVAMWRKDQNSDGVDTRQGASLLTRLSEDGQILTRSSFQLGEAYSEAARTRISEMLSKLFEFIASEQSGEAMATQACEFVSRWIDADRVVLLEDAGEGSMPEPTGQWLREQMTQDRLRLSSTLVDKVLKERSAVLVSDASIDDEFKASASIMALQLHSAMAAPLFDNQRVLGLLYLDCTRPGVVYGDEELQVLSATANAIAVKLRNQSLEKEIRTAARIQTAMLPGEMPHLENYDVLAHLVMCRGVGGDLYTFQPRPNGKLMLALGDVTGKGTPAALAMSACMILLSTLAETTEDLDRLGDILHRKLYENLSAEQFVTLFAGDLDPATGHLKYLNAGHEPPLISRRNGSLETLPSGGQPMGLLPTNPLVSQEYDLDSGDLMAVFSDGIPEATRDGENLMGLAPVERILREYREAPLEEIRDAILKEVNEYLAGRHASDDVTLLLLRKNS